MTKTPKSVIRYLLKTPVVSFLATGAGGPDEKTQALNIVKKLKRRENTDYIRGLIQRIKDKEIRNDPE